MHIDSALHLIDETRYLLNSENPEFEQSAQGQALNAAETSLREVFNFVTAKPVAGGIDLSNEIAEAKARVAEKQEFIRRNNNNMLRLEQLAESVGKEILQMFEANGIEGLRLEYRDHDKNEREYTSLIYICIQKPNSSDGKCVAAVAAGKERVKLSYGEDMIRNNEPYLTTSDSYCIKYTNLAELIDSRKGVMVKILNWLLS